MYKVLVWLICKGIIFNVMVQLLYWLVPGSRLGTCTPGNNDHGLKDYKNNFYEHTFMLTQHASHVVYLEPEIYMYVVYMCTCIYMYVVIASVAIMSHCEICWNKHSKLD